LIGEGVHELKQVKENMRDL